jgi:hypothetical protein
MSGETPQLALWRSDFGRAYTDRNDRDKPERVESWRRLLGGVAPVRALEVGCNVGWNLVYLERLGISVRYRGHSGVLWKRDHGAAWQARHPGLRLVRRLELGPADGYDNCTAHLFEKE